MEDISQQIYSLPQLAALVLPHLEIKILFSRIQRTTLKIASNNDFIALSIFKRVQNYSVFYLIQSFLVK